MQTTCEPWRTHRLTLVQWLIFEKWNFPFIACIHLSPLLYSRGNSPNIFSIISFLYATGIFASFHYTTTVMARTHRSWFGWRRQVKTSKTIEWTNVTKINTELREVEKWSANEYYSRLSLARKMWTRIKQNKEHFIAAQKNAISTE